MSRFCSCISRLLNLKTIGRPGTNRSALFRMQATGNPSTGTATPSHNENRFVVCWQRLPTMSRTAVSRSFSLRPEEAPRFDQIVERMAGGSPTEFIRQAMDRMEALENWELFERVREVGLKRAAAVGITSPGHRRAAVRSSLNRKMTKPHS